MKKSNKKSTTPKFVAKGFDYEHVSTKLIKANTKTGDIKVYKEEDVFNDDNTFDLSELNLTELTRSISRSSKKGYKFFLFTQERENKRLLLKVEHIKLLQSSLVELKKYGRELLDFRADVFLTNETLEYLIEDKRLEFEHALKLKVEEHLALVHKIVSDRKRIDLELLDKEADVLMKKAQVALLNAKGKEEEQNAEFMKESIEEFKKMSDAYKAYMFAQYMNRNKITNSSDKPNLEMESFVQDYVKNKLDENLKQVRAETVEKISKAEFEKDKNDRKMGKL